MLVLGLNEFSHDVGVAAVRDGQIICAAEEERFSRSKHHYGFDRGGGSPQLALSWCNEMCGVSQLSEFDRVALCWREMTFERWNRSKQDIMRCYRRAAVRHLDNQRRKVGYVKLFGQVLTRHGRRRLFLQQLGGRAQVVEVAHHRAHASLAYRLSPFHEALVFVLDGAGEDVSTSVFVGRGNRLEPVASYPVVESIGTLYAVVTRFLGLGRDGEGKTMALAAYGTPLPDVQLLRYDTLADRFELGYDRLRSMAGEQRSPADPIRPLHRHLAATLQRDVNEALTAFVRRHAEEQGLRRVCLGGGVALNVTVNGALLQNSAVDQIFVPPASNDAGTALGAALELSSQETDCYALAATSSFFGFAGSEERAEAALRAGGAEYTAPEDPVGALADDLLAGSIVGLCRGAAELGPRALGNRSILADPRQAGVKERINARVKHREGWRPFAAMVLQDDMAALFGRNVVAPFMNVALSASDTARRLMPDLVHVDGTVRVQTVSEQSSPFHFALLQRIKQRGDYGVLLNTSFNGRGEPLVNRAHEALATFRHSGLDVLYVERFRVAKS